MVAILAKLEPRMEPEGKVLFNAVDTTRLKKYSLSLKEVLK